jgi:hypothetical protein
MSVGVMEDYKLRDLRASHTLVDLNQPLMLHLKVVVTKH